MRALAERISGRNERLRAIIAQRPELEGMGTTLTACSCPAATSLAFAHIGDSRATGCAAACSSSLTADHTWVQRLVDEGRISEEEAGHHPQRSLLMRALDGQRPGRRRRLGPDAISRPGDRLLLCSDGLSSFVSFDTLDSPSPGTRTRIRPRSR